MKVILLNAGDLNSWDYFHDYFTQLYRLQDSYKRNMAAWVDVMVNIDQSSNNAGYKMEPFTYVTIEIFNADHLTHIQREIITAVVESTCKVNYERQKLDLPPYLLVSYYNNLCR